MKSSPSFPCFIHLVFLGCLPSFDFRQTRSAVLSLCCARGGARPLSSKEGNVCLHVWQVREAESKTCPTSGLRKTFAASGCERYCSAVQRGQTSLASSPSNFWLRYSWSQRWTFVFNSPELIFPPCLWQIFESMGAFSIYSVPRQGVFFLSSLGWASSPVLSPHQCGAHWGSCYGPR